MYQYGNIFGNIRITNNTTPPPPLPRSPSLPPELWADILEAVNDWELSIALGIPTSLRPTPDWMRAASGLDKVLLSGSPEAVRSYLTRHPTAQPTKFGAKAVVRFEYTDLLTLLLRECPEEFRRVFARSGGCAIPVLASRFGRTQVLEWWRRARERGDVDGEYDSEPLDEASRKGHVHVLRWWRGSGLQMKYGMVMDVASASGQIPVLEWWKNSGLPLEYDRHALRSASYRGEVAVLEWWKRSGLRLMYDKEVLVEATKFNRVEVLEWWRRSGLTVQYLLVEIEAALEDAIGGGREAMEWWAGMGVRFDVTVREWMEYKTL